MGSVHGHPEHYAEMIHRIYHPRGAFQEWEEPTDSFDLCWPRRVVEAAMERKNREGLKALADKSIFDEGTMRNALSLPHGKELATLKYVHTRPNGDVGYVRMQSIIELYE